MLYCSDKGISVTASTSNSTFPIVQTSGTHVEISRLIGKFSYCCCRGSGKSHHANPESNGSRKRSFQHSRKLFEDGYAFSERFLIGLELEASERSRPD